MKGNRGRVLVVDDHKPSRMKLALAVQNLGHEAASVDSPKPRNWGWWVQKALLRGAPSSAAGPDGLRYSHLKQVWTLPKVGPELREAVANLLDLIVGGQIPPGLADVRVSAVPKSGGDFRPIGVASVLRRMAMYIAAVQVQDVIGPSLEAEGQLGIAAAGPPSRRRGGRRRGNASKPRSGRSTRPSPSPARPAWPRGGRSGRGPGRWSSSANGAAPPSTTCR